LSAPSGFRATLGAVLEERLALMAPSRRLRLALADEVLSHEEEERPIRLLDAGCGDGLLALSLAERHPRWAVVGVDLRENLLSGARSRALARGLGNARFLEADLTRPLPDSGFDAAIALECLHEIPDDEAALRCIGEALVPGGLLAVQVPDRDWRPVLSHSSPIWRDQVRQGYTPDEIAAKVRDAGLELVSTEFTYRSMAALAQEVRDRIKGSALPLRLLAFPFLASAVRLERWGLTWGPPRAMLVVARRRHGR
jgi:SAM-dependent methyltransferase